MELLGGDGLKTIDLYTLSATQFLYYPLFHSTGNMEGAHSIGPQPWKTIDYYILFIRSFPLQTSDYKKEYFYLQQVITWKYYHLQHIKKSHKITSFFFRFGH